MTAEQMIQQARDAAATEFQDVDQWGLRLMREKHLLRDIIRHLCDPEIVPYPMTSPEL